MHLPACVLALRVCTTSTCNPKLCGLQVACLFFCFWCCKRALLPNLRLQLSCVACLYAAYPDTCLGNTLSMLCAPAGTDVGLFKWHMPFICLCATPATLVQAAVPEFPTGLPMGVLASPGGTPISGYITHHVEGSALFTCFPCQDSCHCSHFLSSGCSV